MKTLTILILFAFTLISHAGFAQLKYYEDVFTGGVTVAGYSPQFNAGGTGSFSLSIVAGSTITTAPLIVGRPSRAADIAGFFKGTTYNFNLSQPVRPTFPSTTNGG